MDDQQRARELKPCPFCGSADSEMQQAQAEHYVQCLECEASTSLLSSRREARELWNRRAALRAAPESVALRVAMTTLEQIATAPDDKGAKFNAASCVAFLTTQGAVGTEGFGSLSPVDHVRYWAEAYGPQATEPHFQGHGVAAGLLAEYADLLERLAARPQGVKDAT